MQDKKITNIDEYISNYPKETQVILQKIRKLVGELSPNFTESITYWIPTFKLNKKNIVHFAAYDKHIWFYPTSSGIIHFQNELKDYKCSKWTIQFSLDKAINYELIKKITLFRIEEELLKHNIKNTCK